MVGNIVAGISLVIILAVLWFFGAPLWLWVVVIGLALMATIFRAVPAGNGGWAGAGIGLVAAACILVVVGKYWAELRPWKWSVWNSTSTSVAKADAPPDTPPANPKTGQTVTPSQDGSQDQQKKDARASDPGNAGTTGDILKVQHGFLNNTVGASRKEEGAEVVITLPGTYLACVTDGSRRTDTNCYVCAAESISIEVPEGTSLPKTYPIAKVPEGAFLLAIRDVGRKTECAKRFAAK